MIAPRRLDVPYNKRAEHTLAMHIAYLIDWLYQPNEVNPYAQGQGPQLSILNPLNPPPNVRFFNPDVVKISLNMGMFFPLSDINFGEIPDFIKEYYRLGKMPKKSFKLNGQGPDIVTYISQTQTNMIKEKIDYLFLYLFLLQMIPTELEPPTIMNRPDMINMINDTNKKVASGLLSLPYVKENVLPKFYKQIYLFSTIEPSNENNDPNVIFNISIQNVNNLLRELTSYQNSLIHIKFLVNTLYKIIKEGKSELTKEEIVSLIRQLNPDLSKEIIEYSLQ